MARSTSSATKAASVTSPATAMASPPAALIRSARSWATAGRKSLHRTLAPAAAKPEAMVPPMLGLAPVTMATLPARRPLKSTNGAARFTTTPKTPC